MSGGYLRVLLSTFWSKNKNLYVLERSLTQESEETVGWGGINVLSAKTSDRRQESGS